MIQAKLIEKKDFSGQNIYVGLDVHKRNWNVTIRVENEYYKTFQQAPNPQQLESYLKNIFPGAKYSCAYEAGFCGFWIQREITKRGIHCIVVNPADIPATGKDIIVKTDPRDSKRIALSLQTGQLTPIFIPGEELEADRRLVRFRKTVQTDLAKSHCRIKSELLLIGLDIPERFKGWSKSFIAWLKAITLEYSNLRYTLDQAILRAEQLRMQLLGCNKSVRAMIKDEKYQAIGGLLLKITGIGTITAITLLTEIEDIERFPTFDRLNSFIGFCPTEHTSGDREKKGKITPRGHRILRAYMVEAAWIAVRNDPALASSYAEYTKHMTGKRAIIRIAP